MADRDILFELVQQFATSFRPEREAFDTSMRGLVADDSSWLSIADCGDTIVGYCLGFDRVTFYANGRLAWVEEIMVRSEWRRTGIGARLMTAFEEWVRSRGTRLIALATSRAAPFYTALGYEESARYFRKLL